jgi:hypothetical protein
MDAYERVIDALIAVLVGTRDQTQADYALAGPKK